MGDPDEVEMPRYSLNRIPEEEAKMNLENSVQNR